MYTPMFGLMAILGSLFAAFFHIGLTLPIPFLVAAMGMLAIIGVAYLGHRRLFLLSRMYVVIYVLPFSTLMGFVISNDYVWWDTPFIAGLIQNHVLTNNILLLGLTGLCGLLGGMYAGLALHEKKLHERPLTDLSSDRRAMNLVLFILSLIAAIFFSWLSAPNNWIYLAPYASKGTEGLAAGINFNSAYLISYLILLFLWIDAEIENQGKRRRRLKTFLILFAVTFIVVYFQLLRGDRESFGLIIALILLYVTGPNEGGKALYIRFMETRRTGRILLPMGLLIAIFLMIGSLRSTLSWDGLDQLNWYEELKSGFKQNTWTAILLSNLGMANEYHTGSMQYLWGRTYWEYLLSLPPGVLTQVMGFERPIESWQGPAWWFMGISKGGIHVSLVPFRNFGILGSLLIMSFIGYAILVTDIHNKPASYCHRLIYGAFAVESLHWFWYSDMYIIRSCIGMIILGMIYRAISIFRLSPYKGEGLSYSRRTPTLNSAAGPRLNQTTSG